MDTKQQAEQRLASAERGCRKAHDAWVKASTALGGSVPTNGFGIFHDRAYPLRQMLEAAQANITEALQALDGIEWPTNADYDQL